MTNLSSLTGFGSGGSGGGGGGGGGSSLPTFMGNQINQVTLSNYNGYSNRTSSSSYSGFFPAAADSSSNLRDRNTFAFWSQHRDPTNNYSGFTITTFDINRSNGQVSQNSYGTQDLWLNTSGSALSTTYLMYDPTYGTFFSGGHNAYPGNSSHVFGYTSGYVRADGYATGGGNRTNADHSYNGTFCGCLPYGSGSTNYYLTGGYDSANGSYASGRVISASSVSSPSVGGLSADGNWTSSSSAIHAVYQPDNTSLSTYETMSMMATSKNSPNYGVRFIYKGNSNFTLSPENYNSTYAGYLLGMSSGQTFFFRSNNDFAEYDTSGNQTDLGNGYPDFTSGMSSGYPSKLYGIGDDCYLYTGDQSSAPAHLTFFQVNQSSKQPQYIHDLSLSDQNPSFSTSSSSAWFFVWQNNSDTHPKWAVRCYNNIDDGMQARIETYEITANFGSLKV